MAYPAAAYWVNRDIISLQEIVEKLSQDVRKMVKRILAS
jgi:hypothetical protein